WLSMGSLLRDAVKKLRKQNVTVQMSEPLAAAFALALVAEAHGSDELKLLSSTIVHVRNRSLTPEAHAIFTQHPDRYYVLTIETPDRAAIVMAISARGEVIFQHRLTQNQWGYEGA